MNCCVWVIDMVLEPIPHHGYKKQKAKDVPTNVICRFLGFEFELFSCSSSVGLYGSARVSDDRE